MILLEMCFKNIYYDVFACINSAEKKVTSMNTEIKSVCSNMKSVTDKAFASSKKCKFSSWSSLATVLFT